MRVTLTVLALACLTLLPSDARTQQEQPPLPPPTHPEVQQALQEHKDALASLRTAQRALEASEKRLEALLRRTPAYPATPATDPAVPVVPNATPPLPAPQSTARGYQPTFASPDALPAPRAEAPTVTANLPPQNVPAA
jgi:hypothetical protein